MPPYSTSACVRSGYVAANRIDIGTPSEMPMSTARSEPTASITARTSSIRSSSGTGATLRSERPRPRLSKRIRRLNDASPRKKRAIAGFSHSTSRWLAKPCTNTRSRSPSPTPGTRCARPRSARTRPEVSPSWCCLRNRSRLFAHHHEGGLAFEVQVRLAADVDRDPVDRAAREARRASRRGSPR